MKKSKQRQKQFQNQTNSSDFDMISTKIMPSSTTQQSQIGYAQVSHQNVKQTSNSNINSQTGMINIVPSNTAGAQNSMNSRLANNINCNQLRAGDWVCLLCNNLNFSFRNECNRCMIQTKKQNLMQNLMLVQDESQSYQTEINKNNEHSKQINTQISNFGQNSLMDHQEGLNSVSIIDGNNIIHDNFQHTQDQIAKSEGIQEEFQFEYRKYLNKGESGFENKLLLLTPNRSSIHTDDFYDQRVENTTAPQSNNSNCKTESDKRKNMKRQKKKVMSNGSTNNPMISSCANSDKLQLNDDIFISSNKKDISGVSIQFSSPEEQKYIATHQQQIIGNIFAGNSNSFNAFAQKSLRQDDDKNENQSQQLQKREFQLFGSTNPNNNCPHFMSSPSSMRDDDESLNESDSGNFQQEIQQQINNIMKGEEEDELLNQNNNDLASKRLIEKQAENTSYFQSKAKESNFIIGQQFSLPQTQVGEEKSSFSFGGNLLQKSNNIFNNSRQVEVANVQDSLGFNKNQISFLNQGKSLFENNNSKTGFFNFNSISANNEQQVNNYSKFFNSNHTSQQQPLQSNCNDQQQKNTNIFGESIIKENEGYNIFSNKNKVSNAGNFQQVDNSQCSNGFNQLNSNINNQASKNNNFLSFIDENSNTVPTNNVLNKINQYEKYYQQQDLTNQYTINFEQASSFINRNKQQPHFSQKLTGKGTALFPTSIIDDFADMSDFEDEDYDSSSESRIMKSTKKSNNIRKKKTKTSAPTNLVEMKKKNKLNLQQQNNQFQSQQFGMGIEENNTTSFNNLNQFYNPNQNINFHSNLSNQHQNISNSFQNIPNVFQTNQFHTNASIQDGCVELDSRAINDSKQYQVNESQSQLFGGKQLDLNSQSKQQHLNHNSSQHQNFIQSSGININSINPSAVSNVIQNSQGVNSYGANSLNGQVNVKKQDWICPRCENLNFSFRKLCNKCQFAKNNFAIHIPPNFQGVQQQLTIF